MAAATISLCGSRCVAPSRSPKARLNSQAAAAPYARPSSSRPRAVVVAAKSSGEKADEKVPSWARPGSDEPPPWARNEGGASGQEGDAAQVPFYAYLLASAVTAIAAVRSSNPSPPPSLLLLQCPIH
ncbi:hypothetical protein D1007_12455 [Hordeum vulgare]|nr:hypothetical protein D1007_12455 [Hordeum vulgare]